MRLTTRLHAPRSVRLIAVAFIGAAFVAAPRADAATPSPGWTLDAVATPTSFTANENAHCLERLDFVPRESCDAYMVHATNAGSEPTDGSPITLTDTLPTGLTVRRVVLESSAFPGVDLVSNSFASCTTTAVVQCEITEPFIATVAPDGTLSMNVYVTVDDPGASGPLTNVALIEGGGARSTSTEDANQISSSPPAFGLSNFDFYIDGLDGARDTQAGDHPYELTTTIDLNSKFENAINPPSVTAVEDVKDIVVDLPLGFVGSTLAAPQCPLSQLSSPEGCPRNTQVGHIFSESLKTVLAVDSPIWNLVPERGSPGEFGFVDSIQNTHVFYARVVPTPSGYVLQVTSPDIPQAVLAHVVVTFFGDPAQKDETGNAQIPFFTNPADCAGGPLKANIHIDSWQHPARFNPDGTPDLTDPRWASSESLSPPVTGCDELQFAPQLTAQPTTHTADSPSGLEFGLTLPQTEQVGVHATPALKNARVTFPDGMTVDPSSGNGLDACSVAQIGWLGGSPFNFSLDPPACPEASKIGSLELETPLIPGKLEGAIYLASQNENPFGSTFATYVVVNDPVTGVVLKIAGELKADPHTGRLTAFFPENAQLPFSDLKLHFFGGPRAELATPESCGTFTTTSDLEPWSAPDSGPNGTPFDSFTISEGCVGGFAPAFTAGSTNLQAGAYTNFAASFSRQDSEQEIGGLTLTLPPGLLANVGSVPQCSEAQINEARAGGAGCPESTQVGTVSAFAGPGPNPLFVAGRAYLTGPYNGGPFGLAVVVPAVAGPFTFGNVVVRQSLRIDPRTAQVTDVSDPLPTFLAPKGANGQVNGVPIKLKRIDVSIDRPNFTFNPTSCNKLKLVGSMTSITGASAALSTPFQVTNCSTLKFAPKLTVTTAAKSSRANGASLNFKIAYPPGARGSQAWFKRAKFDIPKQLPARLTTIQKACLSATFEADPAACPPGSVIGHAVVHTQVLPVPLAGPVYFVSHGGAKFPDAVIVLQGDGVTVHLVGETFISGKTGVTSATFADNPDVPFESIEVIIPQGPASEFGANLPAKAKGSFCGQKLTMPTEFIAQNGLAINQNTPVAVTGCGPQITITKHKLRGGSVSVTVSTTAKGLVTITGRGLQETRKTLAAGLHTIKVPLSLSGRRARSRQHEIKIKATLKAGRTTASKTTRMKL
jgi:hypothetical protein